MRITPPLPKIATASLVCHFAASGALWSQDLLRTVVVTASRSPETTASTTQSVNAVTGDDIIDNAFRTLPEALRFTPGVSVQKTTHGHGSPFIRGFTGRQNLYLVDGIRFNNSTFRSGPIQYANTIDALGLDRFELVKSQGSVLYGSDALGGTLNAITVSSGYRDEDPGFFQHGSLFYRYNTNSQSHVGRFQQSLGSGGKWGLTVGTTLKDFGDVRSNFYGTMRGTGYPEQNYDVKFEYALSENHQLTLAHQYLNQDNINRWHRTLNNPGGWEGLDDGDFTSNIYDQERSLTYLRLEGDNLDGPIQRYRATLSYQNSEDTEFQNRNPATAQTRFGNIDTQTYGLTLEAQSDLSEKTSLLFGADYYEDRIDSQGARNGVFEPRRRPLADDATYRSLGLFAQARHQFNERFEFSAGVRYTYAEAELGRIWDGTNDVSANESWNALVGSLRGIYKLDDQWSLFGGVSQGFRAPNVNDLSGNLTTRSGVQNSGNLDLDPERTVTFELGGRHQSDSASLEIVGFYTHIEDLITRAPRSATETSTVTVNGNEAWVAGLELQGSWNFCQDWTLSGFLTYQYGDNERPAFLTGPGITEPLSRVAPLRGSVALRYTHPSSNWWVEGRVIAAAEADRLAANDIGDVQRIPAGGTPSYVTASLFAGYQATENLQLNFAIENLTDEDYRVHGSGLNEPGLGATIGARFSW
ncbi:MAG: TonB-dependent receptor [Akkermansiaceae bacterium]|jgi:hemoglobin/transferrin/lactoferrin receptor protein